MKFVKWLLDLADRKPLLFAVAILLIAVIALSTVVQYQNRELNKCNFERSVYVLESNRRIDSINFTSRIRDYQQNDEMKKVLNGIIDNYKKQAEEHAELSYNVLKAIGKTVKQVKTLRHER